MEQNELKFVIEALLFASERPLSVEDLRQAFEEDLSADDIAAALEELKADYAAQKRGFTLTELAGGFQLITDPRFASYLKRYYQAREKKKLSQATLETLSIIAYKQPVTRADIEFVRGVNVDGALKTLLEKGLVKMTGRKDVPGRPMLYGTTKEFLDHFALSSLKELPALSEFTLKDIDPALLPPELKRPETQEALAEGEQKAVGCANEPDAEAEKTD